MSVSMDGAGDGLGKSLGDRVDQDRGTLRSAGGGSVARPTEASALWIVGWLALVLVGINLVHDPSVHDKTLVPRLHALLLVLGFALPVLALPRVARRLDTSVLGEPVVLCALGLAACTAVSLLVAVNVSAGWVDLVRAWAFTAVLVTSCLLLPLLPRWPDHLLRLLVVSTVVTAGIGWTEYVTRYGMTVPGKRWIEDVSGRMGNINLLSSYLVMLLPGCLGAACLLRGAWRIAGAAAGAASLALVVVLQSRSAYVALAASVVGALALAWCRRDRLGLGPTFRRFVVNAVLVAACGTVAAVALAPDHPVIARLRGVSGVRGADGRPGDGGRTTIWWLTSHLIADHPLGGVGAGNFAIRLPEYYATPGADLAALHTDDWTRPHNDFLQVWAERGILGLAAFVGILAAGCASVLTTARRAETPRAAALAVVLFMSLVAYLVASCFDFPLERVSHQATLAVLLGAMTVVRREAATTPPVGEARVWPTLPDALRTGLVVAATLATAVGLAWTTVAIAQERSAAAARAALEAGRWDDAARLAREAATPWRTLGPTGMPVAFFEAAAHMRSGAADEAIACLERARRHHPNRLVVLNNLGILYAATGRTDDAIECLSIAAARYPHRLESLTNLAGCYLDAGRPSDAVNLIERVPEISRTSVMREHLARARSLLGASSEASQPAGER